MQRHGCGLVVHPDTKSTPRVRVSLPGNPLCEGKIAEQTALVRPRNDPVSLADVRQAAQLAWLPRAAPYPRTAKYGP